VATVLKRIVPDPPDVDGEVGIDLAQRLARIIGAVRLADREDDRIAFHIEPGISNVGVAQRVAHIVDEQVEPLVLRCRDIDLEQQVRAAAQVEPECHLLVRQPAGEACEK
jgi:hypothetical protein